MPLGSMHSLLHVATDTAPLETPAAPYPFFQVYTSTAHLQRSISPYLHVATPTARLQTSMSPCLHVYTPAACLQSSRAPYLPAFHVYTPAARLQHSFLHTSTSARLHRDSNAPDLQDSILPRLYDANIQPGFYGSIAPYIHINTPSAHLQTSDDPYLSPTT